MSDSKEVIIEKLGINFNDIIIVYPDNKKAKEEGFGIYTYENFSSEIISRYEKILKSLEYCLQQVNAQLLWLKPLNY